MKLKIGIFLSSLIEQGRRRIKVLVNGRDDARTTYESLPFGVDGVPPNEWRALYAETAEQGRNVIIGYINQNQLSVLNSGETHFYSTDASGENIAAFIKMLSNGTMQVLGTGDFFVRFNELQTGFNQLRQDLNDHITNYNAHVHTTTATVGTGPPGVISATTSTSNSSSASIDTAKIDEIETP